MTDLDPGTLESLRYRLLAYRRQLQQEIQDELMQEGSNDAISLAGRVHDAQEESISQMLTELNVAMLAQHQHELRTLEKALHRMDTGDYGTCIDCNKPIPLARLEANPMATRCIACQSVHEQN